jgi:hypothetical protein
MNFLEGFRHAEHLRPDVDIERGERPPDEADTHMVGAPGEAVGGLPVS